MRKLSLLACALLLGGAAYAQNMTVKGKVTANGLEMPGVTVSVKGTAGGTITSLDGDFTIKADAGSVLVFSFIGYETVEVPVKGNGPINVELREKTTDLDEVVIAVPYGTAKKSTFTGSAGVVDKKIIANSQVASVSQALQGSVAGLQSFSASGQPGEDATILIRGVGSVNASTTPLYVVDGVPYDGALSSISNQDIASITVLKDAAAASLYGSRAANGVVMITTKQGSKKSAPSIEISAKYGFSDRAVKDYEQVSTEQYFMLEWEAIRNMRMNLKKNPDTAEAAAAYATQNLILNYIGINPYGTAYPQPIGTDGKLVEGARLLWNDSWEAALSQDAHYTDLSARVSGGSENSQYYFSLGYMDNQGAYIGSGFKRYTLRANITSDLTKGVQGGVIGGLTHSIQDFPKSDDSSLGNVVLAARSIPSFYPVYERDPETGAYVLDENGQRVYDYGKYRHGSYAGYNQAQSMLYDKNEIKRDAASVRGYLQVTPIEGQPYKMSHNIDYNSRITHDYATPPYG